MPPALLGSIDEEGLAHATGLSCLQNCFLPTVCVNFGIQVSVSLLILSFSRILQKAALVLCAAHSIRPYGLIPALVLATWHAWYSSKVHRFLVLHARTSDLRFCPLISEKGLSGWLACHQISWFQRRRGTCEMSRMPPDLPGFRSKNGLVGCSHHFANKMDQSRWRLEETVSSHIAFPGLSHTLTIFWP